MKRVIIKLFLVMVVVASAAAQSPNHWINYGQSYYKIPVAKDGMHRMSFADLQQAGFPSGVDFSSIQIFHRGNEVAVEISDDGNGIFDEGDFIRFFGEKNDGTLDAELYKDPTKQLNPYHNLYSDTTAYFLTAGVALGKRMDVFSETDATGLPTQTYHVDKKLLVYKDEYAAGENFGDEIFDSNFSQGEGWTGGRIWNSQSRDIQFTGINQTYPSASLPTLELNVVGRNNRSHNVEVYVGPSLRLLKAFSFNNVETYRLEEFLTWADVSADGKLNVQVRCLSNGAANSISVTYAQISYPQLWNAENISEKIFTTQSASQANGYIEIFSPPSGARLYDVSNPDNVRVIATTTGPAITAIYPDATSERRLLLTSVDHTPGKIVMMNFRDLGAQAHEYVIITHPLLRKPAGGYHDPVKAYAEYRASDEGGGFDTLVVNIQDLYDQFAFGERSSYAIYKFLQFISKPTSPKYLFIIGKGMEIWFGFGRAANTNVWAYHDLIPPGGFPGSDAIFSMGLNGSGYAPEIPTGRLAVMHSFQVAAYLDKIKEKEQVAVNELWQKKILHLSGGIEEGEPEYFRSILAEYATVAEGPYLGGAVSAIAKKSRDLEVINIADEVNNGLALVTFFGHSSTSTLDFDVGYVTDPSLNYHNKGKYPALLMNGCEVGAFFLADTLFGESWVYTRDKGASAFIAHNAYGLISALRSYSKNFYNVAFADSSFFGRGIGNIQKETARRFVDEFSPSLVSLSQAQQMLLLGDPAVTLFGARKPDLEIKQSQLSIVPFTGSKVTALADSFAIKLLIRNYGMATQDTFRVQIDRMLSDNSVITYDSLFTTPRNTDTLSFVIRKKNELPSGNNVFKIWVDADNIISELDENNNYAELTLFIPSNGTKNLYPTPFSIVHSEDIRLSFQATDLYSEKRKFIAELDTTDTFDSPFKKTQVVDAKVLATAQVSLLPGDTIAYYWRTKLSDPLQGESDLWETSSFTYIENGEDGWAQVHFPQFGDDPMAGLLKNNDSRRIAFLKSVTPVDVRTFGASAGMTREDVSVKIKGEEFNLYSMVDGVWGCQDNTVNLIAFDRRSTSPYIGIFLKWYELGSRRFSCGREPFVINSFTYSDIFNNGVKDIIQYVNNIAEGDSVLLFSIGDPKIDLWPAEAKAKLAELGISTLQLESYSSGDPVVIFGRKGSEAGTAQAYYSSTAAPAESELIVSRTVTGGYDAGSIVTPLVGPARKWKSMFWKASELEPQDDVNIEIKGVDFNGREQTLIESASLHTDLSAIDASVFPYLKFKFQVSDPTLLTPSQLDNWIVHFTSVPEGVLLPDHSSEPMVLQEGQSWEKAYRFVNISDKTFADSLSVQLSVFNQDKIESSEYFFNIHAPLPNDTTHFTIRRNTSGLPGLSNIQVFVNPRIEPEQYYDNNVGQLNAFMNVVVENIPPLLDVTFDGKHILNGDYVSENPFIRMELYDENEFLLKSDTTGFEVYLKPPCSSGEPCLANRIWMRNSDVVWHPATNESNFHIDYSAKNLTAGKYVLTVNATDASGNPAAPFEISFTVSDEHNIRIISLHPNPMASVVTYGFIVTGGEIPEELNLKIIDTTGKLVYEENTQGEFSVGTNSVAWDGKDSSKNFVRNGMYIYQILLRQGANVYSKNGKLLITK